MGKTSVICDVMVFSDFIESGDEELGFETKITFVNVDSYGNKQAILMSDRR